MNDDAIYRKYREIVWRRPLTPSEQIECRAWLAAHPEIQADWEAETGLNSALERLADVPVPSNFTSQILHALERERTAPAQARSAWARLISLWHWRWLPRSAFVVVVGVAGLVTFHHLYDVRQEKYDYARSVVAVSKVQSLPNPAVLENFDAIRALDQMPGPDHELLKLYQ